MTDVPFNPLDPDRAPALSRIFGEKEVHVRTPEGITPCGRVHHHVTVTSRISTATCVECLRTIATERGKQAASVATPTGEDAVDVARAILAAAGDTGHMLISAEEWDAQSDAHARHAAWSMRERAAHAVAEHGEGASPAELHSIVTDLPLLPGDTEREDDPDDEGFPVYETPEELAQEITRLRDENAALRSIGELEELVADQANALEGHSRAIADLREQMSSAQASIRGLGQSMTPTTTDDL